MAITARKSYHLPNQENIFVIQISFLLSNSKHNVFKFLRIMGIEKLPKEQYVSVQPLGRLDPETSS